MTSICFDVTLHTYRRFRADSWKDESYGHWGTYDEIAYFYELTLGVITFGITTVYRA